MNPIEFTSSCFDAFAIWHFYETHNIYITLSHIEILAIIRGSAVPGTC